MLDHLIDGFFGIVLLYIGYLLRENTIHINSRMDIMMQKIEEAAVARGNLEGRAEEKKEQSQDRQEAYWKGERKQDEIDG